MKFLCKFKKSRWGNRVGGYQDGCERRSDVFVKIQKEKFEGGGGGSSRGGDVRVDVNEELKLCEN